MCRIQITISLPGSNNKELQAKNIFPLYVLFARPTSNVPIEGVSVVSVVHEMTYYLFCLLLLFSSMALYCSILQYIGLVRPVCLLPLMTLGIMTVLKPHLLFLIWRL